MHTHFFITMFLSSMIIGWLFRRTKNYHARFILASMASILMAATILMYVPGEFPIIRWGLIIAIFGSSLGILWAFREGLRERQALLILQRIWARQKLNQEPAMVPIPVPKKSTVPNRSLN